MFFTNQKCYLLYELEGLVALLNDMFKSKEVFNASVADTIETHGWLKEVLEVMRKYYDQVMSAGGATVELLESEYSWRQTSTPFKPQRLVIHVPASCTRDRENQPEWMSTTPVAFTFTQAELSVYQLWPGALYYTDHHLNESTSPSDYGI